jgi:hypothetical protein
LADITSSTAGKERGLCPLRITLALAGDFGGHYFVDRITLALAGDSGGHYSVG